MKQIYAFITLAFMTNLTVSAQETSVLFLGNSYIYTADLPGTLYNLALEGGDTIYHESNTPGGYTLEGHSTNSTTLNKIASRDWDFVVMQDQSQRPSFPDGQVATQVFPYGEILVDSIKSNYECSEPVFFMTWGRRDGDQQNCAGFPPLCTFEGMQERLRNAYLQMTFDNDATVAPCGAAWQQMAIVNNFFWNGLYSGDGSHPSAWGTYLNACVFYATILRKSPVGIPYYSSIGQEDAETLQQLAEDIVLDSLSTWNIGHAEVVAEATASVISGDTQFQFANSSNNATDHFWDFGDGDTSTNVGPMHTYATSGSYEVMYIASSNCDADTTYLYPALLSTKENDFFKDVNIISNQIGTFVENQTSESLSLTILDVSGRVVQRTKVLPNEKLNLDGFVLRGFNLIQLTTDKYKAIYKLVIP